MIERKILDNVCKGDCGKCPLIADCEADILREMAGESEEVQDENHA